MAKTKLSVLDTLFILFTSFSLLLLVFWMAGQLIGSDLFNELPDWTGKILNSLWGFLISGGISVLIYWLKPGRKNSPNYIIWILATTLFLLLMISGVYALYPNSSNSSPSLTQYKLHFRLNYPKAPTVLAYVQQQPVWENEIRNIVVQPTGYFQEEIDFPEMNKKYYAKITPLITSSFFSDSAVRIPMELCFVRTTKDPPKDKIVGILKCDPDHVFRSEPADPGYIKLCSLQESSLNNFHLIATAHAQGVAQKLGISGWTVPNLHTLETSSDQGFTRINIESTQLPVEIANADAYTASVFVNNMPVFIDGFKPADLRKKFEYQQGIHYEFGLENLGFSGANDGYETIDVVFNFYREMKPVKQINCSLRYVALRNSRTRFINPAPDYHFKWVAKYHSTINKEYEVFCLSTISSETANSEKTRMDNAQLKYKQNTIVGVIRPPLPPNKYYGVIAGLQQSNKQIRFTFSREEAMDLLHWVKQEPTGIFNPTSYLYKIKGD
ncbi:MAG TPA: hypothetical protein VE912_20935 [Bacteroidales bacterium]|nr:hypothetical protein [Bacteroidales bacterium]